MKKPGKSSPKAVPARAGAVATSAGLISFIDRHARLLVIIIMFCSLGLGLLGLFEFRRSPFFFWPMIDEEGYVKWAKDIVAGGPLSQRVFYQDPAYPYFLALVFKLLGSPEFGVSHPSWWAVRIIQVLLGASSVGLVFLAARKLTSRSEALLCSLLFSLCHGLYFYEALFLKGAMVIFFSSLCLVLGTGAGERPEIRRRWFFLGACLGMLSLLRGNFLLLMPVLAVWSSVLEMESPVTTRLARPALLIAGVSLMIFPAALHNYRASGELILTTSQAGANFYLGNNELADGTYVNLPFVRAHPEHEAGDFKAEAERRTGKELSPSQVSRFWFDEAFSWMKKNPGAAMKLWLKKAFYLFHNYEVPDNYNYYLVRKLFMSALWASFIGFGLLWGPALLGMATRTWRKKTGSFLTLFVLVYAGSLIPFYVLSRYRLALLPALSILAVIGLSWLIKKIREKKYPAAVPAAAMVAFMLGLGFYPKSEAREAKAYNALAAAYFRSGKLLLAFDNFDLALELDPQDPEIRENRKKAVETLPPIEELLLRLGSDAERTGRIALAVEVYERAVELFPESVDAHSGLGFLYATEPRARNPKLALEHLLIADQLMPDDPDFMVSIGSLYFELGQAGEAQRWWERTLAVDPDNGPAFRNLQRLRAARPQVEAPGRENPGP